MDPISAFGVAAGVVQFVGFGTQILSRSYKIWKSEDGDLVNNDRESIAKTLDLLSTELGASLSTEKTKEDLSPAETELQNLCKECNDILKQLLGAIAKLKRGQKKKQWASFLAALSTVWKEKEILDTYSKIQKLRERLIPTILVSIREQVVQINYQQQSVVAQHDSERRKFQSIGRKFLKLVQYDRPRWERDLIDAVYEAPDTLSSRILSDNDPVKADKFADAILKALKFPGMIDREENIVNAFEGTFKFIWHPPQTNTQWTNFVDWLESSSTLYWITGKAGSGKSTLMKQIYFDPRTQSSLERWAGSFPLVTAAFFFWNSGTMLQKSREGLLRSLLAQILSKRRELIPRVLPERWEAYSLFGAGEDRAWRWEELRRAIRATKQELCKTERLCLFIDGMDEFDTKEGPLTDIVDLFKDLSSGDSGLKLCVSSRPWTTFEEAFNNRPTLRLEQLTRNGIHIFISRKLCENSGFKDLQEMEPDFAESLINQIVEKSAGVFLWVDLVVTSLLLGLTDGDRLPELQHRVDRLPSRLEDLFEDILNSLDAEYMEHASQLFQLVRARGQPPTLLCLSFADEIDPKFAITRSVQQLSNAELLVRARMMQKRINSRCKGLLEVPKYPYEPRDNLLSNDEELSASQSAEGPQLAYQRVEYLHRTVKEYLEKPDIWTRIEGATGRDFNPQVSLCRSFLLQLKGLPSAREDFSVLSTIWEMVSWCLQFASVAESVTKESQSELLDELFRAAKILYPTWPQPHAEDSMSVAVFCQLEHYVQEKLEKEPRNTTKLLQIATVDYKAFHQLYDRPACRRMRPSLSLVKLLLNAGADPNGCWERILERAPSKPTSENQLWLDIVNLFLQHGASPWVTPLDFPVLRYEKVAAMINARRRWYHVFQWAGYLMQHKRQIGVRMH